MEECALGRCWQRRVLGEGLWKVQLLVVGETRRAHTGAALSNGAVVVVAVDLLDQC